MDTLIKDIFETILKKLILIDVKNVSLTNKYLSEMTTNYMYQNYFYYSNVKRNQDLIRNIILKDFDNMEEFINVDKLCFYNYKKDIERFPKKLTVLGSEKHPFISTNLKCDIPNSVKHLYLGNSNNYIKLPNNLLTLEMHFLSGNKLIDGFPDTIKTLIIKYSLLDFDFPKNITNLTLDLVLEDNSILPKIPTTVTHLRFGNSFNHEISYPLPDNLTHLEFGDDFNQNLKSKLPVSLIKLTLGMKYSYTLDTKELVKYPHFDLINLRYFNLCVYADRIKDICNSVTSVEILLDRFDDNNKLEFKYDLKKIVFDSGCNYFIKKYPTNLESLVFGCYYRKSFLTKLPDTLEYLNLGRYFNKSITGFLPHNLKYIIFSDCFNCEIENALPNSLVYIKFGFSFNRKIIGNIPTNCQYLHFGKKFNQDIINGIPDSVLELHLGEKFIGRENEIKLTVKQLIINKKHIIRD